MDKGFASQRLSSEGGDAGLMDAVNTLAEKLETVGRNQQLLLEAVNLLQWRVGVRTPIDLPSKQDRMRAVEAEIREAVRWKRGQPEPAERVAISV